MPSLIHKRQRPDSDDDETDASFIFKTQEHFARYLIIESTNQDKLITSLSPFVIEKQIEALIGMAKSVKKLKKKKKKKTPYSLRQLEKFKLKTYWNPKLSLIYQWKFQNIKRWTRPKALSEIEL